MTKWVAVAAVAMAAAGCTRTATTKQLVDEAMAAMGGADALRGIQILQMKGGTGTRARHGQSLSIWSPEPVATLTDVIETADLADGRAVLDYQFALPGFTQHRQEILTKQGPSLVGLENVEGRPLAVMSASGLFSWGTQNSPAMLLRRNVVSVLLAAAASAAAEASLTRDLNGAAMKFGQATLTTGESVGLYFDPATKLLAAYETTDTERILGDVTARYLLGDYRDAGGVKLPHHVTILKGDKPYAEVQFASASINDASARAVFAIPDTARAEVDTAIAAGDYSPVTLVTVAEGVSLARAYSHHSMVVEFPTFLVVVEAPYTEAQSKTLARLLRQQYPDKPVRYVVPTHHHYDHIGGVRALAATGATILVDQRHATPFSDLLQAPHTNPPDDLAARKAEGQAVGTLETYNGQRTISEGPQELRLFATENPHVTPIALVYAPASRILFQSDVWIPGVGAPAGADAKALLDSITAMGARVETHVGGHGAVGTHDELVKAVAALK